MFSLAQSRIAGASAAHGENFFFVQPFLGISCTGANLFTAQPVIARDFRLRPALRDEAQNEFDGQPRAANHRFAHEDGGIGGDVVMPVHANGGYACHGELSAEKKFLHLRLHRSIHLDERRPGAFEAFAGVFLSRINAEFAAAGDFAGGVVEHVGRAFGEEAVGSLIGL